MRKGVHDHNFFACADSEELVSPTHEQGNTIGSTDRASLCWGISKQ